VLITAAMSGCRGTDLIGSVNAAPMRLASPKSFIDGLEEDGVKDAILRLIVYFSHTLGLKVTTEGV
jgi:EAL domain-containing protein (putative c-di-GMP-specific phosphodiesterase class I)